MHEGEIWEWSDEKLLAECRVDAHRGSGPGGQNRNKGSAAIRIRHLPTGLTAVAEESRSQHENRIHALRRIRHKLAMEIRREIDPATYVPPVWFEEYRVAGLHMAEKNPLYPSLVAVVLDVLKATRWEVGRAAVVLGISTSALVRVLHEDPAMWQSVNRVRKELGMKSLTWDK